MVEETRAVVNAAKTPTKLNEEQRAGVARQLRAIKNLYDEVKLSLQFIDEAVNDRTLITNAELNDLEEAFDVLRRAAKSVPVKTYKEKAEALLLLQLNDNLPSFEVVGAGKVSSSRRKCWSMTDPELVIERVMKDRDFHCYTTNIREKWCNDYFDQHGKKPPGCDFYEKVTLSFTKSKPKKGQR